MTHSILIGNEAHAETASSPDASAATPATFRNVLVGVDGSSTGRDAIALGDKLCDADGRLTLAHVVSVQTPIYRNFHSTEAGKQACEMLEREGAKLGVFPEVTGMLARSVASGLHELGVDIGADPLVVGSCSRGAVGQLLRGDNTTGTLNRAACAVAVAPPGYAERPKPIETIGVAYNGSPESQTALMAARVLAARHDAVLRVVTAIWPTSSAVSHGGRMPVAGTWAAMMLDAFERETIEPLLGLNGVARTVTVGPPADELLAFGDRVDLLVVGSRGHGALRRLLQGSTSTSLARTARCPLLVVPRGRARPGSRRAGE